MMNSSCQGGTGCGICVEFCRKQGVRLLPGYGQLLSFGLG